MLPVILCKYPLLVSEMLTCYLHFSGAPILLFLLKVVRQWHNHPLTFWSHETRAKPVSSSVQVLHFLPSACCSDDQLTSCTNEDSRSIGHSQVSVLERWAPPSVPCAIYKKMTSPRSWPVRKITSRINQLVFGLNQIFYIGWNEW